MTETPLNTRVKLRIKQGGVYTCRFTFQGVEDGPPSFYSGTGDPLYGINYPAFIPFLNFQFYPDQDEPPVLHCSLDNRRLNLTTLEGAGGILYVQSIDLMLSAKETDLLTEAVYWWDLFFHHIGEIGNHVVGKPSRADFNELIVKQTAQDTLSFYTHSEFSGFFDLVFADYKPGDYLIVRQSNLSGTNTHTEVDGFPEVMCVKHKMSETNVKHLVLTEPLDAVYLPEDDKRVVVSKLFFNPSIKTHRASGRARIVRRVGDE